MLHHADTIRMGDIPLDTTTPDTAICPDIGPLLMAITAVYTDIMEVVTAVTTVDITAVILGTTRKRALRKEN